MFSKLLTVMTVAAVAVNAQGTTSSDGASPTAVAGLTPCILACIIPAASQNGCAYTDVTCVCTSTQFQVDAAACLQEHCTSADLQAAVQLQSAECSALSLTPTGASATPNSVSFTSPSSGSATTTPGATASGSGSTTASTTRSTATSPAGSATTAGTSTASAPATSSGAASSLVAHSGVGAIVAMIAGFLAI